MSSTRNLLCVIGVVGTLGWGILAWAGTAMTPHVRLQNLFWGFLPVLVFVFYTVIAIRPCRAFTALVVGLALHAPLLIVIARLIRGSHGDPFYGVLLLLGLPVWAAHVIQLRRHDDGA
jgi:hypothetical protein